jgi:glycosyltransferase involved in cell wall biosynthesis
MTIPTISIIVCTYNRAAMLREALASLYDLATDGAFTYEIVVVDNASTDDTPRAIEVASEISRAPFRGVYEPAKGIVAARNRGIREARGQWIAFFDDDQIADPRWLAELYGGAQAKNCRVVGGTVRMLLGEAILADQPIRYGGRITPGCGNLMVERCVFDEVGVFRTEIAGRGEDTDLFVRIEQAGIEAWYLPAAIIHHMTPPERLESSYLTNLAGRMGKGIAVRQAESFGLVNFTALWLIKAARNWLVYRPLMALDRLRGNREAALGRQCQSAINDGFLRGGCELCFTPRSRPQATTVPSTAARLMTGASAK